MEVTIREFTRKIYEYLKEGEIVVTKNGEPLYVVTIKECNDFDNKVQKIFKKDSVPALKEIIIPDSYGCGCKRGTTKLCPKHGRY